MIGIAVKRGSSASGGIESSRDATVADSGKTYTNAVGSNVYLTIISGMPRGYKLTLVQQDTGSIGAIAGAGVTFTGDASITALSGQIVTVEWTATNNYKISLGQVPTNVGSTITPAFTMSRTGDGVTNPERWVAPCAVVLDGSGTLKTGETNPIRNLFYSWDFGDTAKANEYWAYGANTNSRSKNRANGPIVGHVYDTPGTYYVTLTVTDAAGNVNAIRQQIIVADPDSVFAGSKTLCFSADGDFTGCPVDVPAENRITTSSYTTAWNTNLALNSTDKRLLFRNGRTYGIDGTIQMKANISRIHIAGFGPGTPFNLEYPADAASIAAFYMSDTTGTPIDYFEAHGFTISNPSKVAGKRLINAVLGSVANWGGTTTGHITLYNIECSNVAIGIVSSYGSAVVDVSQTDPNNQTYLGGFNGIFASNSVMSMLAGCDIDQGTSGEHVARFQGFQKLYVESCRLVNPSDTKHCLALRGRSITSYPVKWQASWAPAFDILIEPTADNLKVFRYHSRSGSSPYTTGATEPDWSAAVSIGDAITDGEITWKLVYIRAVSTDPIGYVSRLANIQNVYLGVPNPRAGSECTLLFQIAPSGNNANAYEPIEDVIVENSYCGINGSSGSESHRVMSIEASNVTIRNLISNNNANGFDTTIFEILGVNTGQTPAASDVLIENCSVFGTHNRVSLVTKAGTGHTGIVIKNTLAYAPNGGANTVLIAAPDAEFTFENCPTLTQMKTVDPGYAVVPPVTADDFKIASGYGVGAGTASDGLFIDYFGIARSRLYSPDMGAVAATS